MEMHGGAFAQTAWGWSATYPGGRYLEIFCVPESTRAEIQAQHPGAAVERIAHEGLPPHDAESMQHPQSLKGKSDE